MALKYIDPDSSCVFSMHSRRLVRNIFFICIVTEVILFLLDAFVNYGKLVEIGAVRRFCNLAREDSLSSWLGSMQTLLVGFTLLLIFLRKRKDKSATKWNTAGWCVLALFFIYMAVDDGAEVHERMGSVFKAISMGSVSSGDGMPIGKKLLEFFPSYPWQIIFMPIFGSMGIFLLIFLRREFKGCPEWTYTVIGITCLVVAVAMDFVEGMDKGHAWNIHTIIKEKYHLRSYTVRHFSKTIEEVLEMLGTTFFWTAFLKYFSRIAGIIRFQFTDKE